MPEHIFIELKTEIGDDYPAVLRQVKNNRKRAMNGIGCQRDAYVVAYAQYVGVGAPEHIVKVQFEQDGFFFIDLKTLKQTRSIERSKH